MLQLPHFDQDLLKRIGRRKVKMLQDLFSMPVSERREVYAFGGELVLLTVAMFWPVICMCLCCWCRTVFNA